MGRAGGGGGELGGRGAGREGGLGRGRESFERNVLSETSGVGGGWKLGRGGGVVGRERGLGGKAPRALGKLSICPPGSVSD